MAKGVFGGSFKGVDGFGKVLCSSMLREKPLTDVTTKTAEDVKIKTRTGAFCVYPSCYLIGNNALT